MIECLAHNDENLRNRDTQTYVGHIHAPFSIDTGSNASVLCQVRRNAAVFPPFEKAVGGRGVGAPPKNFPGALRKALIGAVYVHFSRSGRFCAFFDAFLVLLGACCCRIGGFANEVSSCSTLVMLHMT